MKIAKRATLTVSHPALSVKEHLSYSGMLQSSSKCIACIHELMLHIFLQARIKGTHFS